MVATATRFHIEFDREEDGRWIADIPELPGALAYGRTRDEAEARAEAIALRVVADRIEENQKAVPAVMFD
jgi:predicted RNase H-like HicB family nuclease